MVLVPAGEFMMGSSAGEGDRDEHPRHQVTLDSFYMDKFEVTIARCARFIRAKNRSKPEYWDRVDSSKHSNLPVVGVNWNDADAYCRWAGKRLPTEAEWEKVARGTDERKHPWGNEAPNEQRANFGLKDYGALTDVGSFEGGKSPYGLYDMAGNVWEWVSDWYDERYYAESLARNPKGYSSGEFRVIRGVFWNDVPRSLRSTYRYRNIPTYRYDTLGFRCAQDVPK